MPVKYLIVKKGTNLVKPMGSGFGGMSAPTAHADTYWQGHGDAFGPRDTAIEFTTEARALATANKFDGSEVVAVEVAAAS